MQQQQPNRPAVVNIRDLRASGDGVQSNPNYRIEIPTDRASKACLCCFYSFMGLLVTGTLLLVFYSYYDPETFRSSHFQFRYIFMDRMSNGHHFSCEAKQFVMMNTQSNVEIGTVYPCVRSDANQFQLMSNGDFSISVFWDMRYCLIRPISFRFNVDKHHNIYFRYGKDVTLVHKQIVQIWSIVKISDTKDAFLRKHTFRTCGRNKKVSEIEIQAIRIISTDNIQEKHIGKEEGNVVIGRYVYQLGDTLFDEVVTNGSITQVQTIELTTELSSNTDHVNRSKIELTTELASNTDYINKSKIELTTELASNTDYINKSKIELTTELASNTDHVNKSKIELTTQLPSNTTVNGKHLSFSKILNSTFNQPHNNQTLPH